MENQACSLRRGQLSAIDSRLLAEPYVRQPRVQLVHPGQRGSWIS